MTKRKETLGQKQRRFMMMVGQLIQFVYAEGYELTLGDGYRDPRVHGKMGTKVAYGRKFSNHKIKLAIDLNLFKDNKYLTSTKSHEPFGLFWESIGGSWGGRFKDGNHYSLEHNGKR